MNKTELIEKVAESTGKTKKEAGLVVESVFQSISDALQSGEKVTLIGFGNFEVKDREARKGRNPQTGEEIEIKASKVPSFKAGKQLKDAVNS
ncbi:HU family DNA-binding protein [Risungbinella massiliensis]|uniref:HU family DNA-binding protein n=1 Tax=Risungbinella massiliensis TaxID=1329796 RepID=UPI0005CC8552|nr:HU family DNA-binding protein [Risungbinella massiliensis]